MSGPRYDANWLSAGEPLDFFDLSGTLATALGRVGIAVSLESHDHEMFHPGTVRPRGSECGQRGWRGFDR